MNILDSIDALRRRELLEDNLTCDHLWELPLYICSKCKVTKEEWREYKTVQLLTNSDGTQSKVQEVTGDGYSRFTSSMGSKAQS